jgi:hypothetical protein
MRNWHLNKNNGTIPSPRPQNCVNTTLFLEEALYLHYLLADKASCMLTPKVPLLRAPKNVPQALAMTPRWKWKYLKSRKAWAKREKEHDKKGAMWDSVAAMLLPDLTLPNTNPTVGKLSVEIKFMNCQAGTPLSLQEAIWVCQSSSQHQAREVLERLSFDHS